VVSLVSPYKDQRDKFKLEMGENLKEIYIHTKNERGREGFHVSNYEAPTEFYIDLDTTDERELDTFKKLRNYLGI
jgi:adenylylsulfate kinase-like enzyme